VHHDLYERTNSMISTNYVKLDYVFFRKDKKGINRLLEKCKANIKKLEFPRVEVIHMMQNEAGPSNNTGPDNRMGVSSDLDRQVR
jgi:hypothetical protein